MKSVLKSAFIFLSLSLVFLSAIPRPVHIFMAGDSTMADKVLFKSVVDTLTGDTICEAFKERGWGQYLQEYFDEKVIVKNYAKNGRSTRTFIEEGLLQHIVEQLRKGDFVIIQFGHNDSSIEKKDRYTSPEQYRENVLEMIRQIKSKGATPILCTSVARRKFDKDGHIVNTHGIYPEIMRQVAKEHRLSLIDMQKSTESWLNTEGVEASKKYFHKYAPGESRLYPQGLDDNTHFVESGARHVCALFMDELIALKVKPLTNLSLKSKRNIPRK